MASSKATIAIVPGAWHPPTAYESFITHLKDAGYPVVVASIPSFNAKDPFTCDCHSDTEAVRQQLLALIETDGKDVIVYTHSYGGIPGGGAAHGLSKSTRSLQGKTGGVVGLIYMSAFVVPQGQSLLEYLGGKHAPYLVENKPSEGFSIIQGARDTLFADLDPAIASSMENLLLPHAKLAFESPAPPTAWAESGFTGKIAFLRCTQDQALPLFLQDMFIERSGVKWLMKDIESSHIPYLSKPGEVIKALNDWVEQFEGGKA